MFSRFALLAVLSAVMLGMILGLVGVVVVAVARAEEAGRPTTLNPTIILPMVFAFGASTVGLVLALLKGEYQRDADKREAADKEAAARSEAERKEAETAASREELHRKVDDLKAVQVEAADKAGMAADKAVVAADKVEEAIAKAAHPVVVLDPADFDKHVSEAVEAGIRHAMRNMEQAKQTQADVAARTANASQSKPAAGPAGD